ncbi:hypothetical protein [Oceanithermus sp.]
MRRFLLLALLLLSGCRYTFWPLLPAEESYPQRVSISGRLVEEDGWVIAELRLRRWPEPDYLELRWYRGDELLKADSVWVEGPGTVSRRLPHPGDGFYRLLVLTGDRPLLQLDLGEPSLPPPPSSPDREPAAGSEN